MAKTIPLRTWATPLIIGAFLLMATSGVLMFFGWDRGLTAVIHQWFSWLLVLGAGVHIAANFRPLKNHLKSRWGQMSVLVFGSIVIASFSSWGVVTGPQLKRPIEEALVDAPLSSLAGVMHRTPDALLRDFNERGIQATSTQSIRELSASSGQDENLLLAMVFLRKAD